MNLTADSTVPCVITCHDSAVFKWLKPNSAAFVPIIPPMSNIFRCSQYCFIELSLAEDDSG